MTILEPKELKSNGSKSSGAGTSVSRSLSLSRVTSNSGSSTTYASSRHEKDKPIPGGALAQAIWSSGDDSDITPTMELSLNAGRSDNLGASLGLFEWICQVDSGANLDLKAAWEVSVPVGTITQWN